MSEHVFSDICKQILHIDESIRFAGVANKMGSLEATEYRQGLVPLMSRDQTSQYATRQNFETNIGRLQYSIGKYEKLIRATVPIMLSNNNHDSKLYLLLSFDIDSDVKYIIEKVLKYIEVNEKNFDIKS